MIPQDKIAHALGGFAIAAGCALLGFSAFGLFLSILVGLAKEVWDHFNPPHVADPLDALATIAGGLLAFTLAGMR